PMSANPAPPPEELKRKDFITPNDVRWCPGCGDYAILNSLQRTLPDLGIERENYCIISGIGCSSRFPYYMQTYGFHTIHGRAPSVATGVKVANPELSVWIITGDGDGLSIGGNHLMHLLRRNVNVNVLLFNNRIYGLTKGQYSPTSPEGTRTKTTPGGSIDHPINPLLFALGAEATFIARTVDNNPKHMVETFKAAHAHQGVSFIEIFQNCVIFNDGAFDDVYSKTTRDEQLLFLEEGKPLTWGGKKEHTKGIRLKGIDPEVVELNDVDESELLVHDPKHESPIHAQMLANLAYPDFPTPIGVFRQIQRPTYETQVNDQVTAAQQAKGTGSWKELLHGKNTWTVEG
ncbi:MAG: 2-oxoacid:ferredoxin oxidoreductase subunit beta, partial [Akkermansiaceae bacterium]|nr:2-oxoacid:ferredoxin oxidoreductase subunit beta [Akkermansiaceae bacterium]